MIYTSYYANANNIPKSYECYQVSNSAVDIGRPLLKLDALIPSWNLVSRSKQCLITKEEYEKEYLIQLNDVKCIIEDIIRYSEDHDIILLCYEKPPKFCHRHIIAKFINNIKEGACREL